jgi:hypothetical protein
MFGVGNRGLVTVGHSRPFALVVHGYHPYLFTAHPSSALEALEKVVTVVTVKPPRLLTISDRQDASALRKKLGFFDTPTTRACSPAFLSPKSKEGGPLTSSSALSKVSQLHTDFLDGGVDR